MLETEIKKLTDAIEALTAAINTQGIEKPSSPSPTPEPEPEPESESEPKPTPATDTTPEPVEHQGTSSETETVSRDELKDMCLSIVRDDKDKKPKLAEIIGSYNAKTLKQVPDEKLAELKQKLESL